MFKSLNVLPLGVVTSSIPYLPGHTLTAMSVESAVSMKECSERQ